MSAVTNIEHIVLDMDGTLIGSDHVCPRPHLAEFLAFCFEHFESVNIWTAAPRDWWEKCFAKHIKRHMPPGHTFHRVWVGSMCKRDAMLRKYKPLSKYYKRKWGMTRSNTVIVDDYPLNYIYDQGNALPIDEYLGAAKDDALLELKNKLVAKIYYGLHMD